MSGKRYSNQVKEVHATLDVCVKAGLNKIKVLEAWMRDPNAWSGFQRLYIWALVQSQKNKER